MENGIGSLAAAPAVSFGKHSIPKGTIILARPLHELYSHVKNCECPSFVLIARVLKTLVLSLWRRHFHDHLYVMSTLRVFCTRGSSIDSIEWKSVVQNYPYLEDQAVYLTPNNPLWILDYSELKGEGSMVNPTTIMRCISIYLKLPTVQKPNYTVQDLLCSPYYTRRVL